MNQQAHEGEELVGALDGVLAWQILAVVLFPKRLEFVDGVRREKAHALTVLPHRSSYELRCVLERPQTPRIR